MKAYGIVEEVHKNGQNLNCEIKVLENGTIMEFPYIYYPGYKIIVDAEEIESFESEHGFLAISWPETYKAEIVVEYVGTNLMMISKLISAITLISMIVYVIYNKNESRIKRRFAIYKRK